MTGCNEAMLYNQLDEQQVNEIIAVLGQGGISAEKKSSVDKKWSVLISNSDFANSMELLEKAGLPRSTYQSMGELFKKEGFIASPLEERARFLDALSQELARTISNIDGVIIARVHVALPEKVNFNDKTPPASVSVFIKHRHGVDLYPHLPQIKSLVLNGIEGVLYDRISVSFFQSEIQSPIQPDTPAPLITLATISRLMVLVFLMIGTFIAWRKRFILQMWLRKQFSKVS
jgi:type III secretion protein J